MIFFEMFLMVILCTSQSRLSGLTNKSIFLGHEMCPSCWSGGLLLIQGGRLKETSSLCSHTFQKRKKEMR